MRSLLLSIFASLDPARERVARDSFTPELAAALQYIRRTFRDLRALVRTPMISIVRCLIAKVARGASRNRTLWA
jgi:hypothetical protein